MVIHPPCLHSRTQRKAGLVNLDTHEALLSTTAPGCNEENPDPDVAPRGPSQDMHLDGLNQNSGERRRRSRSTSVVPRLCFSVARLIKRYLYGFGQHASHIALTQSQIHGGEAVLAFGSWMYSQAQALFGTSRLLFEPAQE